MTIEVNKSTVRDALSGTQFESLNASQVYDLGGKIFPSVNTRTNQIDIFNIMQTWRSIHAPTFSGPIPQTSTVTLATTVEDAYVKLLSPSNQEVFLIQSIYTTPVAGAETATFTLYDGTTHCPIITPASISAGTVYNQSDIGTITCDSSTTLYAKTGMADEGVTVVITYYKVVQ